MSTTQTQNDSTDKKPQPFATGDTLMFSNGHEYKIRNIYEAHNGSMRVKLHRVGGLTKLYPKAVKVMKRIRSGKWEHTIADVNQ